jgi:hypothetical protein
MPMFKKNLKLIATAIGLVAVLVMGLAMLLDVDNTIFYFG